jgi:hypothetical protein
MEHLNHLTAEAARLKQKAEQAKDCRTALAGVREMSRLLELVIRLAMEAQERISSAFEFDGRPLEKLSDVELLQIIAREQGMTETRFLRIAHGENLPEVRLESSYSRRARASWPPDNRNDMRYSHLAPKHTMAAVERLDAPTETPTDTTTNTRPPTQIVEQVAVLR